MNLNVPLTHTDLNTNLQEIYMEGKKFDEGKPRMDLLPMDALMEVAKVLTFGAKKYGDRNWEKGIDAGRLRAAQLRHDAARQMGELNDPETGITHTAHKACDVLMELALELRDISHPKIHINNDLSEIDLRQG